MLSIQPTVQDYLTLESSKSNKREVKHLRKNYETLVSKLYEQNFSTTQVRL